MKNEKASAKTSAGVGLGRKGVMSEKAEAHGRYFVECHDASGNLKFRDTIDNLVTTAGKNDALDKYLSGTSYSANFYIGLVSGTGYTTGAVAADTADNHAGWQEDVNYSEATRPAAVFASAAGGSKSLSAALTFSISDSTTIKGCFLATVSTKGGTSGILYSAGLFSGGDKIVSDGDTLSVSYTASL